MARSRSLARRAYTFPEVGGGGGLPEIVVTPSTWDFGSTPVGTPVTKVFTIDNPGSSALVITLPITSDHPGYTITVDPDESVAPGASTTFTIEFDSAFNANGYAGNISIVSNAASSPTVIPVTARIWAFYASGASNTAEIGTATRVQNDGTIASDGTEFDFVAQTTPAWGDLSIRSQEIAMLNDVAMVGLSMINESTRNQSLFGWYPTTTIGAAPRAAVYTNLTVIQAFIAATQIANSIVFAASTDYPLAIVARDTDADANVEEYQIYIRVAGAWLLLWILLDQNDASMFLGFSNFAAVGAIEQIKAEPLPATIFNPAIEIAAPVVGVLSNAPSGNIYLSSNAVTVPSAGSIILAFRIQDANNYWQIEITSAGAFELDEVVSGVVTNRLSSTITTGQVLRLRAYTTAIRIFKNETSGGAHLTATNFQNALGLEIKSLGTGGALANLTVYNADASAASTLDAVLAG